MNTLTQNIWDTSEDDKFKEVHFMYPTFYKVCEHGEMKRMTDQGDVKDTVYCTKCSYGPHFLTKIELLSVKCYNCDSHLL